MIAEEYKEAMVDKKNLMLQKKVQEQQFFNASAEKYIKDEEKTERSKKDEIRGHRVTCEKEWNAVNKTNELNKAIEQDSKTLSLNVMRNNLLSPSSAKVLSMMDTGSLFSKPPSTRKNEESEEFFISHRKLPIISEVSETKSTYVDPRAILEKIKEVRVQNDKKREIVRQL